MKGIKLPKNVTIIGAGIIGLSAAWKLAEQGFHVTVLEKGKCGSGSTTASLGALVPYNASREDEMPTLQRNSLWSYPKFINDLHAFTGIEVGYKKAGRLQIIQNEHQKNKLQQDADIANEKWPHNTNKVQKILSVDDLKILEPELSSTPFGAMYCQATAYFEPKRMVAALRSACMKQGVDIRENSPAVKIMEEDGVINAVHSATGLVTCDAVIMAAGAWSKKLLPTSSSIKEYVAPLKGQALEISTPKRLINHMVRGLGVYLIQVDDKTLLLGGTKEKNAGFDETLTEEAEGFLLTRAEQLVPAIAECKVVKQWAGFRPYSEQGAPFIGWDNDFKNLYHATGHAGIGLCLTPYTCQKILEDFKSCK
ncbi:MAG: hypothetical protein CMF61_07495 [Magnetococcales bacterium]|nr:hypothetical protein [Magnetococcales bacterium]